MYTDLITILGLSFLLGVRHATDADHVVAVTTILARQKKGILKALLVGIYWGIGHSITVTLVGIPIIVFSLVIPLKLELFLEFIVGLMLVILGILNLTGMRGLHNRFQIIRPVSIGLVHGLAGSAAIALLILSTIQDTSLAIMYLFIFHLGVLTGMIIITILIGASLVVARSKSETINHYLVIASGFISIIFGLYIMYQTGMK